jgi:hypothetical protein
MIYLPKKIQTELHELLLQQGFNVYKPDIGMAWQVFKKYLQLNNSNWTINQTGVEIYHAADRDNILWLDFQLSLSESNCNSGISFTFSRQVPTEMVGISKGLWWNPEQLDYWNLDEFLDEVEIMPALKACMILTEWQWEPVENWVWDMMEDLANLPEDWTEEQSLNYYLKKYSSQ